MDTLTFDTPARRRTPQLVPVTLCGEDFAVERPKDAVLYFAQTITGDSVGEGDRAMGLVQFINSALDPADQHRFMTRALDNTDPLDVREALDMVGGLLDRWGNWPTDDRDEPDPNHQPNPVVVEPQAAPHVGNPIHIVQTELDLDMEAHPPKRLMMMFAASGLAAGATLGQQAWAISLFLDAALSAADAATIAWRMRNRNDDLDLEHIAEIVEQLLQRWQQTIPEAGNRAERRAAAKRG